MKKLAAIVAVTVSACLLPFTILGVLFFGPMVVASIRDRHA